MTSSGARRRSSTCSSTSPCSRPTHRFCFSASPGASSRSARGNGRSRSGSSRCRKRSVDELIPKGLTGDVRTRITCAAGRKPPVRHRDGGDGRGDRGRGRRPCQPCRRSSPRDSTSSRARSARCWSEARSRERSSTAARFRRSSDGGPVTPRLASLVRKGLIRPVRAQLAGDDAFRFTSPPDQGSRVRRTAQGHAEPTSTSAFADWLERRGELS